MPNCSSRYCVANTSKNSATLWSRDGIQNLTHSVLRNLQANLITCTCQYHTVLRTVHKPHWANFTKHIYPKASKGEYQSSHTLNFHISVRVIVVHSFPGTNTFHSCDNRTNPSCLSLPCFYLLATLSDLLTRDPRFAPRSVM